MSHSKLLLLPAAIGLLLAGSLVSGQRAYAQLGPECEFELFDDFLSASDEYTVTFRSWYLGEPESCHEECVAICQSITDPNGRLECMSHLPVCEASCDNRRLTEFHDAQDSLIEVGARSCPLNIDFCARARGRRDKCTQRYFAQMEFPVFDENGNYDDTWFGTVITDRLTCLSASGIEQCE
jgi:hypothetical protein